MINGHGRFGAMKLGRGMSSTQDNAVQPPLGRIKSLDGIRAIAICSVMLFHLTRANGEAIFGGGALGVSVFFVLSGFLITSGLLTEIRNTGAVSLRTFYNKRFWRLAPALGVLLVLTLITSMTSWPEKLGVGQMSGLRDLLVGWGLALGHIMNFALTTGNYHEPHELGMTWSLNVEEQFYLGWVLIVVAALALGCVRWMGWVAGIAAMASLSWGAWLVATGNPPRRVAWSLDTQLGPVLLGAALAFALTDARVRQFVSKAAWPLMIVAVPGMVFLLVDQPGIDTYIWKQGVIAVCSAVVIACLFCAREAGFSRFFGSRPFVWIGERSYGIYLFHGAIFIWLVGTSWEMFGRYSHHVFVIALSLAVAALSYRFVERPLLDRAAARRAAKRAVTSEQSTQQAIPVQASGSAKPVSAGVS